MNDKNIIDGKQKKINRFIEVIISALGWIFMLGYLIKIITSLIVWAFSLSNFYEKLFIINNSQDTIRAMLITVLISIIIFITMFAWGKYNYNRYAHLTRRQFPKDTTQNEVAEYFNLPINEILKMQNDKRIELEKTIV